jgi:signal transduction histidine kinase
MDSAEYFQNQSSSSSSYLEGTEIQGNILIVDDTPDNLRLLSRVLSNQGYEVRSAISGSAALMAVAAMPPDLILLDIRMPYMDGYEVCNQLKANPQSMDIPVIFLSAYAEIEDKIKAFEVGGIDYITKPFQTAEVLVRVRTHLALRNTQRALQKSQLEALQALEREQELNRLKSEFVSMVSHDFRSPLTTIQGFALLLRDAGDQLEPTKQIQFLTKIEGAVEQMLNLLDRVLLIGQADLEALKFEPQVFDLKTICLELIGTLQITYGQTHQIELLSQGAVERVYLDPNLCQTILDNLLSNAIKYSPQGGPISLELNRQDQALEILVKDHGIGIPEANLARLFEPFQRGSNAAQLQGTGLGLAIVRKCVEAQSGTITVKSQLGMGTQFRLLLPQECYNVDSQR